MRALLPAIVLTAILSLMTVAPTVDSPNPSSRALKSRAADDPDLAAVEFIARAFAAPDASAPPDAAVPFEITEDRPRCNNYNPKRQALFGTTHLHTGLSFDASIRFVDYANGNDPRGAYRFAKGMAPIKLPEPSGSRGRTRCATRASTPAGLGRRDRPLRALRGDGLLQGLPRQGPAREPVDGVPHAQRLLLRAAHQPGIGEEPRLERVHPAHHHEPRRRSARTPTSRCATTTRGCAPRPRWRCGTRSRRPPRRPTTGAASAPSPASSPTRTPRRRCSTTGTATSSSATTAWSRSRSTPSTWRWWSTPTHDRAGRSTFRRPGRRCVPDEPRVWPVPPGTNVNHPLPQPFWNKLEEDCTKGKNVTDGAARRCDFITIPHNSNLGGGGRRWSRPCSSTPTTSPTPSGTCRWSPWSRSTRTRAPASAATTRASSPARRPSTSSAPSRSSTASPSRPPASARRRRRRARAARRPGATAPTCATSGRTASSTRAGDSATGINPFKMGVVSASDSHTGVMGWHPETEQWPGHLGIDDAYPMAALDHPERHRRPLGGVGGGEHPRLDLRGPQAQGDLRHQRPAADGALLRRLELRPTPAARTSSTSATREGVPMGGDLPARPPGTAPRPSSPPPSGTTTSRPSCSRSRSSRAGSTRERRDDTSGSTPWPATPAARSTPQAALDRAPARPSRLGRERLCAVWKDPTSTPSSTPSTTCACSRSRSAATARCGAASGSGSIRSTPTSATASSRRCERQRPPEGQGGSGRHVLLEPDHRHLRAAGDPGARLDLADLVRAADSCRLLRVVPALHMLALGALLFAGELSGADSAAAGAARIEIPAHRLEAVRRTSSPTPAAGPRGRVGADDRHAGRRRGALPVRARPRHAREPGGPGAPRADRRASSRPIRTRRRPTRSGRPSDGSRPARGRPGGAAHPGRQRQAADPQRRADCASRPRRWSSEYCAAHPEDFTRPARTRISQVAVNGFVAGDAKTRARAAAGADPRGEARPRGRAGARRRDAGAVAPAAADRARTCSAARRRLRRGSDGAAPGSLVGADPSDYGHHLVWVHEHREARLPPLAAVREQVEQGLLAEAGRRLAEAAPARAARRVRDRRAGTAP